MALFGAPTAHEDDPERAELGNAREHPFRFGGPPEVADALERLLGGDSVRRALSSASTHWSEAALALIDGDFGHPLALYEEAHGLTDVAFVQLRAAEASLDRGFRAEADSFLQTALAFYRSVGATRYVREGEALLAAAS